MAVLVLLSGCGANNSSGTSFTQYYVHPIENLSALVGVQVEAITAGLRT